MFYVGCYQCSVKWSNVVCLLLASILYCACWVYGGQQVQMPKTTARECCRFTVADSQCFSLEVLFLSLFRLCTCWPLYDSLKRWNLHDFVVRLPSSDTMKPNRCFFNVWEIIGDNWALAQVCSFGKLIPATSYSICLCSLLFLWKHWHWNVKSH